MNTGTFHAVDQCADSQLSLGKRFENYQNNLVKFTQILQEKTPSQMFNKILNTFLDIRKRKFY